MRALASFRVLAVVTCEIVEPRPEQPTEGFFIYNVDFSPMADPAIDMTRFVIILL